MVRVVFRLFLSVWLLAFAGHAANAAKRVAPVIGNGAYANAPTRALTRSAFLSSAAREKIAQEG